MAKTTKRSKVIDQKLVRNKVYAFDEAVGLLKEFSSSKFKESLDISVNLGVDPRKSDQVVRGSSILPGGSGKDVRVAVFTQGENAELAKQAGADVVGMEDLSEQIKNGDFKFDVVIASPDAMRIVGQLGQILGPRGLMPNPKVGTVTPNVAEAVKNAKSGQVRFRTDKNGIIHTSVGKVYFELDALKKNIDSLVKELKRLKPASSKGVYLKKITISSTMGPGIVVDMSSLDIK